MYLLLDLYRNFMNPEQWKFYVPLKIETHTDLHLHGMCLKIFALIKPSFITDMRVGVFRILFQQNQTSLIPCCLSIHTGNSILRSELSPHVGHLLPHSLRVR